LHGFCNKSQAIPANHDPQHIMIRLSTTLEARVLRHHPKVGLTTLFLNSFELRVPKVDAEPGTGVAIVINASDVSIALSRPMDVSITNRLPGTIIEVEYLEAPYARVTFDLGSCHLHSLVTWESVERLGLEPGLKAWAMIKTVAIERTNIKVDGLPEPRPPFGRATADPKAP
jgi:molybdate transport system ATP-binding protein